MSIRPTGRQLDGTTAFDRRLRAPFLRPAHRALGGGHVVATTVKKLALYLAATLVLAAVGSGHTAATPGHAPASAPASTLTAPPAANE